MDLIPKLLEELNLLVETNKQVAELERIVADQQLKISELSGTVHEQNFRIELLETEIEELKHDQVNSQKSSSNSNQRQMVQCEPNSSERPQQQNQEDCTPNQRERQAEQRIDFLESDTGRASDSEQQPTETEQQIPSRVDRARELFNRGTENRKRIVKSIGRIGTAIEEYTTGVENVAESTVTIDVEARPETPSADLPESNNIGLLPTSTSSGSVASGTTEQRRRKPNNSRQPQSPTVSANRKRKSKKRRKPKGFAK